jgi:hypothetical protein
MTREAMAMTVMCGRKSPAQRKLTELACQRCSTSVATRALHRQKWCAECARHLRRATDQRYRAENRERIRRYRIENRERMNAARAGINLEEGEDNHGSECHPG